MAGSALLVMDVQRDVVDIVGVADSAGSGAGYLPRLRRAIDGARAAGVPVIYVVMRLPAGDPRASARSKVMATVVRAGLFAEGAPGTEIHPDVAPEPGEVVVAKRRASAFSGSDLDLVLRARDIDHLVLAGIATSAVVLSTACRAIDLDLGLTVLADACLDTDPELHRVVTENLFPLWGDVLSVDAWLAAIGSR
ncbi:Nicotinamidase-related amidase [Actinacidiphila yanglinensis]|uniref:Nicotinamidase-related amidase n=1 Tax=Actinacidiphila yanglinensis TaxID=310779 RepID=A0A1H6D6Q7_9ACTN|nr:cysteine hydrolase [Actinacidiphila yanglinensis]SEG81069.1 Nicotinamidase-related amidase [Actinacidiphila yanglinensis]